MKENSKAAYKFLSRSRLSSNFKFSASSLFLELERTNEREDKHQQPYFPFDTSPPRAPGPGRGSTSAIKGQQQPKKLFSGFPLIKSILEFPKFEFEVKGLEFA